MKRLVGRVGLGVVLLGAAIFSSCGSSLDDDGGDGSAAAGSGGTGTDAGAAGESTDGGATSRGGSAQAGMNGVAGDGASGGEDSGGTNGGGAGGTDGATGGSAGMGGMSGGGASGRAGAGGNQAGSGGSACPGGGLTTLRGTVYDPTGTMPIHGALVYVPRTELEPFSSTVACERCADLVSGSPARVIRTNAVGQFVLELDDIPDGSNVELVVQVGKWRRVVTLPSITECTTNDIDDPNLLRLPRNRSEGDMPRIAVTTGSSDAFECLLLKMGISVDEFTTDSGDGRVHLYSGGQLSSQGATGLASGGTFSPATALWSSPAKLASYDLVLMSCEGSQNADMKMPHLANIEGYANAGGHLLLGHLQFYWLRAGSSVFRSTANYIGVGATLPDPTLAAVDTTFARGAALANWLFNVEPSTTFGRLDILEGQHSVSGVNPPTRSFLSAPNPNQNNETATLHLTFDTPITEPASNQCGRVALTDLHVNSGTREISLPENLFPSGCTGTWTPQARALAFLVYDLACVFD